MLMVRITTGSNTMVSECKAIVRCVNWALASQDMHNSISLPKHLEMGE